MKKHIFCVNMKVEGGGDIIADKNALYYFSGAN